MKDTHHALMVHAFIKTLARVELLNKFRFQRFEYWIETSNRLCEWRVRCTTTG